MSTDLRADERMVHIRYDGRSHDVPQRALDIGDMSTDAEVKTALAVHLDVPVEKFRNYAVNREATGHITVRPEAVFG
jgi:hypothetical protein